MNASLHTVKTGLVRRHRRRRHSRANLERGVDSQGRFIGPHDVDRAHEFFFSSRRSAPLVHTNSSPTFSLRRRGRASKYPLTALELRAIFELGRAGVARAEIAAKFELPVAIVYYHLRPSIAMRAALARTPAP